MKTLLRQHNYLGGAKDSPEERLAEFEGRQEWHRWENAEELAIRTVCEEPDEETGKFSVYYDNAGQSHKMTDSTLAGEFDTEEEAEAFADAENERIKKEGLKDSNFVTVELPEGYDLDYRIERGSFSSERCRVTLTGSEGGTAENVFRVTRLDGEITLDLEKIAEMIPELIEIVEEEEKEAREEEE